MDLGFHVDVNQDRDKWPAPVIGVMNLRVP